MGLARGGKRIPGARIIIYKCSDAKDVEKVIECISKHGLKIKAMCTVTPEDKENALLIHLDTEDASQIMQELKSLGYSAELRKFLA
jgi:selenophosphate synthetase-related protein